MATNRNSTSSIVSKIAPHKLDQMLGLRGWGLLLYGALPASLSLFGIVKVEVEHVDKLVPMFLVSLLPLMVTFLLVRARLRDWYFTTDYLNLRATITTLMIVVIATVIAAASGVIRSEYDLWPLDPSNSAQRIALAESFLFGVGSLVISSSLFATILTKGADLPGLPASGFVSCIAKMRQQLIAIQNNSIWQRYEFDQQGTKIFDDLTTAKDNILKELETALSQPGHRLAKRDLASLRTELEKFARSMIAIRKGGVKNTVEFLWQIRFADLAAITDAAIENLRNEREVIKDEIVALQKLKRLRLGG